MQPVRVFLLGFLLLVSLCPVLPAEESKSAPTIEQLQSQVDSLKAQLAELQTTSAFELRLCSGAVQAAREFITKPAATTNPQRMSPRSQQNGPTPKAGIQQ